MVKTFWLLVVVSGILMELRATVGVSSEETRCWTGKTVNGDLMLFYYRFHTLHIVIKFGNVLAAMKLDTAYVSIHYISILEMTEGYIPEKVET